MTVPSIHHLTLTAADVAASAHWYQRLLGPATIVHRKGPDWTRVRMQWPGGLVIGVTQHESTSATDACDHTRIGLDHVGLGCADEAEVRAWAQRMDDLGIDHGPVEDVSYGWAVTARDPDGIPVEFFAGKPQ